MGWDKKIKLKLKTLIANILFIAILLLIITRFLMIWTGGSFPINLVKSNSMNPILQEGDIVAWTPTKIEEIETGDIIVFESQTHLAEKKMIIHRVTDIKKDNSGEIILETKGDNNKYTDQAGPHSIEPYIKEEKLIGKTISIGKTPVKIPIIGQIGLIINEGIKQLSQPSASKETIPIIGIFTPMISSIIIFFLLIFTIPERKKTRKEKIKQLIFGPNANNLKKTFLIFLIAYLSFFSFIHIFAHDSTTASFGLESNSPKSSFNLGKIEKGQKTLEKQLPVVNPGITKVKGIVYPTGELNKYIQEENFELEPGETKNIKINAQAKETDKKGSYKGKIMIYSSPFWIIFSDQQLKNIYDLNPEYVVLTLDLLTSLILTTITITLLAVLVTIEKQYNIITTNRLYYTPKIIIRKKQILKIKKIKSKTKEKIRKINNYLNLELLDDKIGKIKPKNLYKPIAASLAAIPLLFYINDQITATIIAGILSGIIAFFISCKLRKKIILTSIITLTVFVIIIFLTKSHIIINPENNIINNITLATGTIGVYMLFIGILMLPIPAIGWISSRLIRNVNEHRKPLLILDGDCDL